MDALPNELLAQILAFFHPVYDNLARLSLVCKRWKDVIENTPSLWKCIHFTRAYPFCVTEYARHRDALRHCLLKFGHYVTCLRDHPITRTFTDPSLRELLSRLTSLTCLDVPLLEWDPGFLQTLQCANVLEELNLTEYLRSEPPEIQWLFQQPETLEKNFITPQHLQMVILRFPRLKVLKLALDSIAFPPSTLIAFLDKVNLTKLELSGFGLIPSLPPHIIHNRDMCLKTIASSQRLAAVVTRLELRTCPLFFTSDHLRIMLKLMKTLRHLFVGAGMVHRDRKSLLSVESASLLTLGLDGLSTLRMQCLRCNTPALKEFQLANCLDLTALFVNSKSLESMCLRNLSNFHNLKCTSTRLNHLELVACPAMPITTLRNFLKGHQTIKKLSIIGELTGLTLYGAMCPQLRVLNLLLCQAPRLGSIKIDCPTLENFLCDVYRRGPVTADEFCGFPQDRSMCAIFIRSRKLERVSINLPNATAIAVKCEELKHLSVTMGETPNDSKAALDFEVIAGTISFIRTTNCKFSRFHLQASRIGKIGLQLCEMEGDKSIPRLDVEAKAIDKLVLDNCHHLQCAELRVKPDRIAHVSFSECNNLRNIVLSRAVVKNPPEMSVVKCKNLESILLSSGRQIDLSNVNVSGCPCLNIPKLPQNGKSKVRLVGVDENASEAQRKEPYLQ